MTPEEFWAALHDMPEPKPVFRRLYYDAAGDPICYTMDDLPGNYIEVDVDTYVLKSHAVKVVQGKLVHIKQGIKLRHSDSGVSCDPRDVCVVVDPKQPHTYWNY